MPVKIQTILGGLGISILGLILISTWQSLVTDFLIRVFGKRTVESTAFRVAKALLLTALVIFLVGRIGIRPEHFGISC